MCTLLGSTWPTTSRPTRVIGGRGLSERENPRGRALTRRQKNPIAQHGHDAFAEPVRLFEVRVAGEDELGEPELVVFGNAIGDLVVGTYERGTDPAAHESDSGPHVRIHDQPIRVTAVQRRHALLPD